MRAPIDIVAKMDDAPVGRPLARNIFRDGAMHARQEIKAAVHIGDCI